MFVRLRPSHTDLPSVSTPPLPKAELDEVRLSDNSQSQGTRECLPSSDDASCHPARPMEEDDACSQSGDRVGQERLSVPIREQDEGIIDHTHSPYRRAPASQLETPPPVHRKAHRKTNRRKTSESSSSSQRPGGPGHGPQPHLTPTDHRPGPGERPWLTWQRERREAHREDAFSSGHTDPLDQTIEEVSSCSSTLMVPRWTSCQPVSLFHPQVIQRCCYGAISCQDDTDSFQLSLPVSMETPSEDWDSPVQVPVGPGKNWACPDKRRH